MIVNDSRNISDLMGKSFLSKEVLFLFWLTSFLISVTDPIKSRSVLHSAS